MNNEKTSSVEQCHVKFMARSTVISKWVTQIHGLSTADINANEGDVHYVSMIMLVEEANAECTILIAGN